MGKVSVLLLIHRRPNHTRAVLDTIRQYQPESLYVVADGPRISVEGEADLCRAARSVIDEVDWDCDVQKLFRDENLGCRLSVSGGIDWFFEQEEMGIILEDDTVADPSFFGYCEELLQKYANEELVAMVSGNNHTEFRLDNGDSYFFSPHGGMWGWATWRRAWSHYDSDLVWAREGRYTQVMTRLAPNARARAYWRWVFGALRAGAFDTWDFQWSFTIADRKQLVVIPALNLVSNIGFGSESTHTSGAPRNIFTDRKAIEFPLQHPTEPAVAQNLVRRMSRQLPERRRVLVEARKIRSLIIGRLLDPVYLWIRERARKW